VGPVLSDRRGGVRPSASPGGRLRRLLGGEADGARLQQRGDRTGQAGPA
jgi:hypothetical protein